MSFRFPNSLINPTSFNYFNTPEELVNPTLNPLIAEFRRSSDFRLPHLRTLFASIYCDHNLDLTDYDEYFFRTLINNGYYKADLVRVLKEIPEADRWIFPLFNFHRINNDGTNGLLEYQAPHHDCCSRTSWYIEQRGESKSFITREELVTFLKEQVIAWQRYMTPDHELKMVELSNIQLPASGFFYHFFNMCMAGAMITDSIHGNYLNGYQALQRLSDSTKFKITCTHTNISITLTETVSRTNRRPIERLLNYSTDVTAILPWPNRMKGESNQTLLMGVELELSTDYTVKQVVDAAEDPFFLAKQDGSISGRKPNMMELVTAPSTMKYLKRQYALWFNALDYSKFDTTIETTNGMHVHLGREFFHDNHHIRNFCWFFHNPANLDFVVALSERGTYSNMSTYTPVYNFPPGCSRVHAYREVHKMLSNGHRGATNFKNGWAKAKTIEVRIFRGIVSYASVVKNLEAVDSIFHYTGTMASFKDQTLTGYLKWLKQTPPNKYQVLKKFIESLDMEKILVNTEVKDVIFNETNEEKIVLLMNKSSLKLHNGHVSILNRGKKRTFVLNKETGLVELSTNNKGKMSYLDKILATNYLRHQSNAA